MKKLAVVLILFGSGLAAFGISGFSGELSTNLFGPPMEKLEGSFEWPMPERVEIVVGVISLVGGLILRKDSN
jgi:uncharacterized membrane protein YphA (DoxX/SURF4 family)